MPHILRTGIIFSWLICSLRCFSQADPYPGTWEMNYRPHDRGPSIHISMQIAKPDRNLLYPAQLQLKSGSFRGIYHLLLVKKNKTQLGISKLKSAITEEPFSLGSWTTYLNNIFTYAGSNGATLTNKRLKIKKIAAKIPEIEIYDESFRAVASNLQDFLQKADIILMKTNPYPWRDEHTTGIMEPGAGKYFGVMDTVHLKTNTGKLAVAYDKKNDNDTVSISFNGRQLVEELDIRKKNQPEEIELEKGLNILIFFADNYGRNGTGSGKLNVAFGKKKILMDFNKGENAGATFIVAKLYYYPGNEDSIALVESRQNEFVSRTLQRITKRVGQIETKSEQITLALWDDAVEDGDSISLNINGKWLVQGFAVKKATQFIPVTLEPGPNQIIFIADNLGAIIPNTSVLEIIDGKMRKSFKIETNFDKNNLINIFYDYNPER